MVINWEKCAACLQRSLLTCWIILIVTDVMYMGIASVSLGYFGGFQHSSFVYYKRVNIETLVVATLGAVSGAFGAFGTVHIKRRVVLGSLLALLATFALLVAAYMGLRQLKNPFAEHSSAEEPTSEVMEREMAAYMERLDVPVSGAVNRSRAEAAAYSQLRFMNMGQRIFQCCGKLSYRDYGDKLIPRSCCRDTCLCPTRWRRPTARLFNTSVIYHVGCVTNMYHWVVLVTLAGLNLAAFCLVACGCILLGAAFLFLHRNKSGCGSGTPPPSDRSNSRRSLGAESQVVVVVDDGADESLDGDLLSPRSVLATDAAAAGPRSPTRVRIVR